MDNFATQPPKERKAFIDATAGALGLIPLIVENGFWVCWVLKRLFESSIKDDLIFKGGTSLSKAHGLIQGHP